MKHLLLIIKCSLLRSSCLLLNKICLFPHRFCSFLIMLCLLLTKKCQFLNSQCIFLNTICSILNSISLLLNKCCSFHNKWLLNHTWGCLLCSDCLLYPWSMEVLFKWKSGMAYPAVRRLHQRGFLHDQLRVDALLRGGTTFIGMFRRACEGIRNLFFIWGLTCLRNMSNSWGSIW